MKWYKPDKVIIMGDLIDFYAISRFVKDPVRALRLQKEVDEGRVVLEKIKAISPKAEIHFIYGNHEDRLKKYKWANAKEFSSLRNLELEKLLEFDKLNIISHPNGRMRYKGLVFKHGDVVRKFSGYTAKAEFEKTGTSGVSVHTHRLSLFRQRDEAGNHFWVEGGCLCELNAEYLHGARVNWQQGFAIMTNGLPELVPITKGKAFYGGNIY
jgi:hypothetical protein